MLLQTAAENLPLPKPSKPIKSPVASQKVEVNSTEDEKNINKKNTLEIPDQNLPQVNEKLQSPHGYSVCDIQKIQLKYLSKSLQSLFLSDCLLEWDEIKIHLQSGNSLEKTNEELKKILVRLIENEDFSFDLRRTNKDEIYIQFMTKDSVLIDLEEIKKILISATQLFMENLTAIGLNKKEHYDVELNWQLMELQIISTDIIVLNCIGALLKDAGQHYWNQSQLATTHVFFKPSQKRDIANINPSNDIAAEKEDSIKCRMQ